MFRAISKFLMRAMGWVIITEYDELPQKYVIIAIPHTSNWDFPIGIMVRSILGFDAKYVGKDSLFKTPVLGTIMRWLGGYPVDRSKSNNFVDAVVDIFNSKEEFAITIAPEGTRKRWISSRPGSTTSLWALKSPSLWCNSIGGANASYSVSPFSQPVIKKPISTSSPIISEG